MAKFLSKDGKFYMREGKLLGYTPPMPAKGSLIKLDLDGNGDKQYRVLAINGSVAKVLGMSDISTSQVWGAIDSTHSIEVNGELISQYKGSNLDTYINTTWYNMLSTETKSVIVPETIVQDSWLSFNLYKGATTVGERTAYALSIQDIVDYMGVDLPSITKENIWKMFWNIESAPPTGSDLWLRSGWSSYEDMAWFAGANGIVHTGIATEKCVRPAFNIDLSKINFTKV